MALRVCILSDTYEASDSPIGAHDLPCDPAPYLPDAECTHVRLDKRTAVRDVIALADDGYDVFFNLCDGAWDEDRPGLEVVLALERLGAAFTGATSSFYEPTREAMKRVCAAWDVPTSAYAFVDRIEDLDDAVRGLPFPLIVKHPSSYSSIGLTPASRVEDAAALRRETARMLDAYGRVLVEAFVEGREFTVLVAEDPDAPDAPTVYPPVEFRFPPGESFKHFALKWIDHGGMSVAPCTDAALDARLRETARRVFVGLGGTGYGRLDVRVARDGTPFVLEINPNCGVFYPPEDPGSADFILARAPGGHRAFAEGVVRAALARRDRARRPWIVRALPDGGYGTFAARDLAPGACIEPYEERPHVLVTRSHVEAAWDERRRAWFAAYAYPLTDEVYVMWDPDPEAWRPINHACDPNAWLAGLDLVARRSIAAGEEITMDYATFCNETTAPFACACGAAECRGTVRGTDYLSPFVARYGDHVSDYVRRARAAAAQVLGAASA